MGHCEIRIIGESKEKEKMSMYKKVDTSLNFVEREKEIVEYLVKTIMENSIKLSVPLEVDIQFGINWYDAK